MSQHWTKLIEEFEELEEKQLVKSVKHRKPKLNHKKDNLYFILGSDTAMNIKTWNNFEILPALTKFLIALRKEDNTNNLKENFPFDYELIDGQKLDLSSTSLREKLQDNLIVEEDIPSKVLNYIKRYSLY